MQTSPRLEFKRLSEVPIVDLTALLNDPKVARHMPLAGLFTEATTKDWVKAKEAQWDENGYGPWALYVGGAFAGWGGFQKEDGDADFALLERPAVERGDVEWNFLNALVAARRAYDEDVKGLLRILGHDDGRSR